MKIVFGIWIDWFGGEGFYCIFGRLRGGRESFFEGRL